MHATGAAHTAQISTEKIGINKHGTLLSSQTTGAPGQTGRPNRRPPRTGATFQSYTLGISLSNRPGSLPSRGRPGTWPDRSRALRLLSSAEINITTVLGACKFHVNDAPNQYREAGKRASQRPPGPAEPALRLPHRLQVQHAQRRYGDDRRGRVAVPGAFRGFHLLRIGHPGAAIDLGVGVQHLGPLPRPRQPDPESLM